MKLDGFAIDLTTETINNGISCFCCVRTSVKPKTDSDSSQNAISTIDKTLRETVKDTVHKSNLLSDRYIVDFDCTRDNLNPIKWSRLKVNIYTFTRHSSKEKQLISEITKIIKKVCKVISTISSKNQIMISDS